MDRGGVDGMSSTIIAGTPGENERKMIEKGGNQGKRRSTSDNYLVQSAAAVEDFPDAQGSAFGSR